MRKEVRITLIRTDQRNEAVWIRLLRFAREWNRHHIHRFTESMGLFLDLTLEDSRHSEHDEILRALKTLDPDDNIQVHVVPRRIYDANDYATADFVEINGVALDETSAGKLTLNAREVLSPEPCPECGYYDAFSQVQSGPFVIDESKLDRAAADGRLPPPDGWDFVEVGAGHKVISSRFAALLSQNRVQGHTVEPVLTGRAGVPSTRISQLLARRAIVCPCPEHTRTVGGGFCQTCGAADCEVVDEDWVRSDWLGQDEIFARHRNRAAVFYVSGRVYRLLVDAGLEQIKPGRIFRICDHG